MLVKRLLKTKIEYKNFKKQEIQGIFIKTKQIKLAFNMTWLMEILKIYHRGKVLHEKAFKIAKNKKYDGHQRGLASMIYEFFDERSTAATRTHKSATQTGTRSNFKTNNWQKNYTS